MLQDIDDIVARVGVLLEDPNNLAYTPTYIIPFIDQEYDEMDVALERIGMQYVEGIAIFNIGAQVSDLSPFLQDGQPLATMKYPKEIRWKLQNLPDIDYIESEKTVELDEVDVTSIGAIQWRFGAGAIQVTPSSVPLTLKIFYDQISTNITNSSGTIIMGTAHILALRVTYTIANTRGLAQRRIDWLKAKKTKAWMDFCVAVRQPKQAEQEVAPALHPRRAVGSLYLPASSSGV